jgi:uncharacterized membrane protein YphA (DoxX/SURF4 family)
MSGSSAGKTGWAGGRRPSLLRTPGSSSSSSSSSSSASSASSSSSVVDVAEPSADAPVAASPGARPGAWLGERVPALAAEWAPVAGRALLGLVFLWFGFHELEHPGSWTQYVPVISESSNLAIVLVLLHGWVLFVLGFALIAGIEPRWAAALASVIMLEIVISLIVTGLSDTALRDVGILGLAFCLTGVRQQRLVLRG